MMGDKRIHTRSFPNVEDGRLVARLEYMRVNIRAISRGENGKDCSKNDFCAHVREIINVERELTHRGIAFTPVTNGAHLQVSTHDVRYINPPPSRRERERMA